MSKLSDTLSDVELKQILITTDGRGKEIKEEALELLLKRKEFKFVTGGLDFSSYSIPLKGAKIIS